MTWRESQGTSLVCGGSQHDRVRRIAQQGPHLSLRLLLESFTRWRHQRDALPQTELAEIILDESGYTEMWQNDKSPEAQGKLENLKELVRSMGEFENLEGFMEHISLVMDRDQGENTDEINIMTLHSAKGLEFGTVFLPGWEEGLFPHQRSLDDKWPRRIGRGTSPRLRRHHPCQTPRHHFLRAKPPGAGASGNRRSPQDSSTNSPPPTSMYCR